MTDETLPALLLATDPQTMARLHQRLTATAEREGLLDIGFDVVDSPVGRLLLAATEVGLVRVAYAVEDHDAVLADLATRVSPRVLRAPDRVAVAARQLEEYFAGRRRGFEVPLDLRLSAGFRRSVLDELRRIEFGGTRSYAEIAVAAGSPRAVRAVGSACATNPIPVVVPCHRVVRADGAPGGYIGGPDAKRSLLALERAAA